MSLGEVEPMETDKYSGNKEIFDQLSHCLPKNHELLFHSLKFFVQDCIEVEDCVDVHSLLDKIDETTVTKNIPESAKYYYLYSMFDVINKQMKEDYLMNAMGVLSPYSQAGPTCSQQNEESSPISFPMTEIFTPQQTLGHGQRAPPSQNFAPAVSSHHSPAPAVHPAKVGPSTPISDLFLLEIADALPSQYLEKFAIAGIGMSLINFENKTDGMNRHQERARAVLKWWGQHSGGTNPNIPAFTKQGLLKALKDAKLNGVCQDLKLV